MSHKIRLAHPFFDAEELEEVRRVLETGYVSQGPLISRFESLLAEYLGGPKVVAVNSATSALHLSMVLLGIGPGDEVIVPGFTFPATVNVVIQQGARPVLADVRTDTFNMDPASLEERITPRTRAIMVVHAFGNPADMDSIGEIASARRIPVVEDAACALGSRYRGRPCGTLGQLGCFSFHARKVITTGEGGAIVGADGELLDRARRLRQHGGERLEGRFEFREPGFNYRISDLQAAVAVAQMKKLEGILRERSRQAEHYDALLAEVPRVARPSVTPEGRHTWQTYCVLLDQGIDRDRVIRELDQEGIETTFGTYALQTEKYLQSAYGFRDEDLPGALRAGRQSLALPLHPRLKPGDQERVVDQLHSALRRNKWA